MATPIKRHLDLSAIGGLADMLSRVRPSAQKRILVDTALNAGEPIVRLAKAKVQKRSGALAKAITVVAKNYPTKKTTIAYIGAQKGMFKRNKSGKARRLKKGEDPIGNLQPHKYSHLLENGHRVVKSAKGGSIREGTASVTGYVKPYPFLTPAAVEGEKLAQEAIGEGFGKALEAEINRSKSKLKRLSKA